MLGALRRILWRRETIRRLHSACWTEHAARLLLFAEFLRLMCGVKLKSYHPDTYGNTLDDRVQP